MAYQDGKTQEELRADFEAWAHTYDEDVATTSGFPFAGYGQALATVFDLTEAAAGMSILDLGVGTGNLARLFAASGCEVMGADFAAEMLAKTGEKLPGVALVQVDLTQAEWPAALEQRFDRIVSNYTFHEFPLATKVRLLARLAANNLASGGRIVIGDIAFPTGDDLDRARVDAAGEWEEEYYWTADETQEVLARAGWDVAFHQVSFCAGVFVFQPPTAA